MKAVESLFMLSRCRIRSTYHEGAVSIYEPNDQISRYIDFLRRINPSDWGNDENLLDLIENIFYRKEADD
jgi:hypothetical protein